MPAARTEALLDRPLCADPRLLPIVDAAVSSSSHAPRARAVLASHVCPCCPIRDQCHDLGMLGEHGVWGGTTRNARTRAGAPKPPTGRRSEP